MKKKLVLIATGLFDGGELAGSTAEDINGDGHLDIAAGRNYYLAPQFTKTTDYRDGAETNGPDVDDNYEGTMDVNNDGCRLTMWSDWA